MSVIGWLRNLFVKQEDLEYKCLEKCLKTLSPREEEILAKLGLRLHDDKTSEIRHRKAIAAEMGITYNHLRIEVHRIRGKVQHCVRKCLKAAESDTKEQEWNVK